MLEISNGLVFGDNEARGEWTPLEENLIAGSTSASTNINNSVLTFVQNEKNNENSSRGEL